MQTAASKSTLHDEFRLRTGKGEEIASKRGCEQKVNLIPSRYDIRALANFVLDLACERGKDVSNLSINKNRLLPSRELSRGV